jgi:hypothetical protein
VEWTHHLLPVLDRLGGKLIDVKPIEIPLIKLDPTGSSSFIQFAEAERNDLVPIESQLVAEELVHDQRIGDAAGERERHLPDSGYAKAKIM